MCLLIEALKGGGGGVFGVSVRGRERVGGEEEGVEGLWSVELDRLYGVRDCLCGLKRGFLGRGWVRFVEGWDVGQIGEALEGGVFGHRHT